MAGFKIPLNTGSSGSARYLDWQLEDGVLSLSLNRPQERNLINLAMLTELGVLLEQVREDRHVRVIVLHGNGDGFSSGIEPVWASQRDDALLAHPASFWANEWPLRQLRKLPQPLIAMVHGYCEEEALALLAASDIVLTAQDTRFVIGQTGLFCSSGDTPLGSLQDVNSESHDYNSGLRSGGITQGEGQVRSGQHVSSGAARLEMRNMLLHDLSRVMSMRAIRYHMLTAEPFDGRRAEAYGLATFSVPPAELESSAYSMAKALASKDGLVLQFTKEAVLYAPQMDWDAVLSYSAAKRIELELLQRGTSSLSKGVDRFLTGNLKPGRGE